MNDIDAFLERFPRDRWDKLFMAVYLQAESLRRQHNQSLNDIRYGRFFAAYLVGFPNVIADNSEFAAVIRKGLLDTVYGLVDDQPAFVTRVIGEALVAEVLNLLSAGDEQARMGFSCGDADGSQFFSLVEAGEHPYGEETFAELTSAFEDGSVKLDSVLR